MKDTTFLVESVRKLLRRGATSHLLNMLQKVRAADLADVFKALDDEDRTTAFHLLAVSATSEAAALLSQMHPAQRAELLRGTSHEEVARVVQRLPSDDVAEILSIYPQDEREQVLALMQKEASEEVQDLLEYKEETAGRIMNTGFLALPEETRVQEAIAAVQKAQEAEMVFYLYVVDAHGHLQGVLSLRRLLSVPPSTSLREIMSTDVIAVRADTDQEEVARIASRYDLLAVPVVDSENVMVGIVTIDDVIDVIREEATEDFYKLAGTSDQERLQRSTLIAARHRLPWLTVSLVEGILAVSIFTTFEETFSRWFFLIGFLPMLVCMEGNIGTQSATIVVRGLATGRFALKEIGAVLLREMRTAGILGFG